MSPKATKIALSPELAVELEGIAAELNQLPDALLHDTRGSSVADQVIILARQVHRLTAVVLAAVTGMPLPPDENEEFPE